MKTDEYVRCEKCGSDLFEDLGIQKFARIKFQVLKCIKCGNVLALETKSKEYKGIFLDKREKNTKISLIK